MYYCGWMKWYIATYFQSFIHLRWCTISSINSRKDGDLKIHPKPPQAKPCWLKLTIFLSEIWWNSGNHLLPAVLHRLGSLGAFWDYIYSWCEWKGAGVIYPKDPDICPKKSRWWFQTFFIFIPTWGDDPIWRAYFSNGFVQPPTRNGSPLYSHDMGFWMFRPLNPTKTRKGSEHS